MEVQKSKANKAKSMPVQAERDRPAIIRHQAPRERGRMTCKVVETTKDRTKTCPFLQIGTGKPGSCQFHSFPFPAPNDGNRCSTLFREFKARSISFNLVCGRRSSHDWWKPGGRERVCEANSSVLIHLRSGANPVGFDEHCDMI